MIDWSPILLTLELASITTAALFLIALPLARWLAYTNSKWKVAIEALISLPLVLPPTVIGFYLLLTFSPNSAVGSFLVNTLGIELAFSFTGLVIGSIIYSLPFMVQPLQAGFRSIPNSFSEASYLLGKSKRTTLLRILLPNMKPAILTGMVLTFAHTIGEFGVVLMIGGNIPDQTKVVSIAIYDEVESLNYANAHAYSALLICVTFLVLLFIYSRKNKSKFLLK